MAQPRDAVVRKRGDDMKLHVQLPKPMFGTQVAMIVLGEVGIRVTRSLRTPGHFDIVSCPGPIEGFTLAPQDAVSTLARTIARHAARCALSACYDYDADTVRLTLQGLRMTFTPQTDPTWLIRVEGMDEARNQQGDVERVFHVLEQDARSLRATEHSNRELDRLCQ